MFFCFYKKLQGSRHALLPELADIKTLFKTRTCRDRDMLFPTITCRDQDIFVVFLSGIKTCFLPELARIKTCFCVTFRHQDMLLFLFFYQNLQGSIHAFSLRELAGIKTCDSCSTVCFTITFRDQDMLLLFLITRTCRDQDMQFMQRSVFFPRTFRDQDMFFFQNLRGSRHAIHATQCFYQNF